MNQATISQWIIETLEELTQAHWLRNTQGETKALDDIKGCCETAIKLLGALEKANLGQPTERKQSPETPAVIELNKLSNQTIQEILNAIQTNKSDTEGPPRQDLNPQKPIIK